MRQLVTLSALLGLALTACDGGETGFTNTPDDATGDQGNGVAEIIPTEIHLEDLDWEQGISQSAQIKVTNAGDANLKIYSYGLSDSADGVLYAEEESNLELSPGADREFTVVATLEEFAQAVGEVRIRTSDSDAIDVRIPVTASPLGWEGDDTGTADGSGTGGGGDDTGAADGSGTGGGGSDTGA